MALPLEQLISGNIPKGYIPTIDDYNRLSSMDYFGMNPAKIPSYAEWVSQYYNTPAIGKGTQNPASGNVFSKNGIPTMDDYIRLSAIDYFGMDPSKIPSYEDWVAPYYGKTSAKTGIPDLDTPLPTPKTKISDWYRQYLGRDPETEGLNFWTNAAYGGTSLGDIQSAIQNSEEGRAYAKQNKFNPTADGGVEIGDYVPSKTGIPDLDTPLPTPQTKISDWYRQYLGRDPETAGLDFWTNAAYGGTSLGDIQSAIQNSEEGRAYAKQNKFNPTADGGVEIGDYVPYDIPQTKPATTGFNPTADGGVEIGDYVPYDIPQTKPSDVGFGGSQYGALLTNMYNQYLGRNPEAEGFNNWSAALSGGASEDSIRNAIANSPEAQQYAATQAGLNALG